MIERTLPFDFAVPPQARLGDAPLADLVRAVERGDATAIEHLAAMSGLEDGVVGAFCEALAASLEGRFVAAAEGFAALGETPARMPARILAVLAQAAAGDVGAAVVARNAVCDEIDDIDDDRTYVAVGVLAIAVFAVLLDIEERLPAQPPPIDPGRRYVVGYPRSGTTQLLQYLRHAFERPYSVYPGLHRRYSHRFTRPAPWRFAFIKDHVYRDAYRIEPVIAPVRDGRAASVSLARYLYGEGSHDLVHRGDLAAFLRFVAERMPYGSWGAHTATLLDARDAGAPIRFVRFEDVSGRYDRFTDIGASIGAELGVRPRLDATAFAAHVAREKRRLAFGREWSTDLALPDDSYIPPGWTIGGNTIDWRRAFDAPARRAFHELGGTEALLRLGYETDDGWWRRSQA